MHTAKHYAAVRALLFIDYSSARSLKSRSWSKRFTNKTANCQDTFTTEPIVINYNAGNQG